MSIQSEIERQQKIQMAHRPDSPEWQAASNMVDRGEVSLPVARLCAESICQGKSTGVNWKKP